MSGCRFGSAHLRSKADAPGARGTSADASFTAPPRAARWRDSSVFQVLCGPGLALDAPASGPFALAFGFPGRSLHCRAVSAPFSSRPLAVAARGLAGRLPWRSSGHALLPVGSPSWLALRLGALPACSPRRLRCPTRFVGLAPPPCEWCLSRGWAARLLGWSLLRSACWSWAGFTRSVSFTPVAGPPSPSPASPARRAPPGSSRGCPGRSRWFLRLGLGFSCGYHRGTGLLIGHSRR